MLVMQNSLTIVINTSLDEDVLISYWKNGCRFLDRGRLLRTGLGRQLRKKRRSYRNGCPRSRVIKID